MAAKFGGRIPDKSVGVNGLARVISGQREGNCSEMRNTTNCSQCCFDLEHYAANRSGIKANAQNIEKKKRLSQKKKTCF